MQDEFSHSVVLRLFRNVRLGTVGRGRRFSSPLRHRRGVRHCTRIVEGGGLIRDGFLLHRTPLLLTNGVYLELIGLRNRPHRPCREMARAGPQPSLARQAHRIDRCCRHACVCDRRHADRPSAGSLDSGCRARGSDQRGRGRAVARCACTRNPASAAARPVFGIGHSDRMRGVRRLRFVEGIGATQAAFVTIALFFVVRALTVRFNWTSSALLR